MIRIIVVLSFVATVLVPLHHLPIPLFLTEWVCASSALVAMLLGLQHRNGSVRVRLDSLTVLILLYVAVAIGQAAFGVAEPADSIIFVAYILFAGLCYQVGCMLGSSDRRMDHVGLFAVAIIFAALSSCLMAAFQLNRLSLPFDMAMPARGVIYGNIGQRNHFNSFMWLGVASVLFLSGQKRLSSGLAFACTLCFIAFSVLSGSRSGFLYAFSIAALAAVLNKDHLFIASRIRYAACLTFPLYLFVFAGFSKLGIAQYFGVLNVTQRLGEASSGAANELRFGLWRNIFSEISFTGVGVGHFQDFMREHPVSWESTGFQMFPEHAHNQFLDVAFELGWGVGAISLLLVATWLWRRRLVARDDATIWAGSVACVIGIHAMLEYPLRYTYFLLPFCLALGFLASNGKSKSYEISKRVAVGLIVFFLGGGVLAYRQYMQIDAILIPLSFNIGYSTEDTVLIIEDLDRIPSWSPFKRYADFVDALIATPEIVKTGRLNAGCDSVVRVWMATRSLGNCTASYMLSGDVGKAVALTALVCRLQPEKIKEFLAATNNVLTGKMADDVVKTCESTLPRVSEDK